MKENVRDFEGKMLGDDYGKIFAGISNFGGDELRPPRAHPEMSRDRSQSYFDI